ncbi:MAG: ATP-binding protein [Actinomycetota bacterium]
MPEGHNSSYSGIQLGPGGYVFWVVKSLATFTFRATAESVPRMRRFVARWLSDSELADPARSDLLLATTEAVGNACRHTSPQGTCVHVCCSRHDGRVSISISDNGPGFTADCDPLRREPVVDAVDGRGLYLMRRLTDHLSIVATERGTRVTLERNAASAIPAGPREW